MRRIHELAPELQSSGDGRDEGLGRGPARARRVYGLGRALARPTALFERMHGAVAFAGEHTAGDHSGTMEGALRSGTRAAAQVLELLGRG